MIEVTHDQLILYLMLGGIVCLALIFLGQLLAKGFRRLRNKKRKVICRLCNYHFLNPDKQDLIACPNCRGLNEPGKDRRL